MKGERTIDDKPFRYGGIMHDYDRTSEEWAERIPEMRRCYICGGKMRNIYSASGTLLKKTYPYAGVFRFTKGKNKGMAKFRILCRACAYDLGRGVIEMDGHTYTNGLEFSESKFKDSLKRGICYNCKHLKKQLPSGYQVVHLDGDNTNFDIDNLCAVSHGEHAILSINKWHGKGEITKTAISYARLRRLLKVQVK